MLSGAYLINNLVFNFDRVIIKFIIGSDAVTVYYVAALLGKTVALLFGPLSSIMLSYLIKYKITFNVRRFVILIFSIAIMGGVVFAGCMLAGPLLVRILYPNVFDEVQLLLGVASLAQIFYFMSIFLLTLVLTICGSRWQLRILIGYAAIFMVITFVFMKLFQLQGFALGALLVNMMLFILIACLGLWQIVKSGLCDQKS